MIIQRWVPPARGVVPALLGAAQRPFGRFVVHSAIASTAWAVVIVLGVHFGGPRLVLALPIMTTLFVVIQVGRRLVTRSTKVSVR